MQQHIAQSRGLRRSGNHRESQAVCRHLTKEAVFGAAAQQVQHIELPPGAGADLIQSKAVLHSQTLVNAAYHGAYAFRYRLSGLPAKVADPFRQIAGGGKARVVRVDKAGEWLRRPRQLL